MYLVRLARPGSIPLPDTDIVAAIRHLRADVTWHVHEDDACVMAWCVGPGLAPKLTAWRDGSWLLVRGTPAQPGRSMLDPAPFRVSTRTPGAGAILADCADLTGLYTLIAFDAPGGSCSLVTDRSGMVPVYVAEDDDGVWISSSALAIACVRPVSINPDTIACLAVSGYCLRDLSLFNEVRRIGPGKRLDFHRDGIRESAWWSPAPPDVGRADLKTLATTVLEEGSSTLHHRLKSVPCPRATLTAGLDSRCAMALTFQAGVDAHYLTADTGESWEVPGAKRVAAELGLDWSVHHERDSGVAGYREMIIQTALLSDGENHPFRGTARWSRTLGGANSVILWGLGGEAWRDYWSKHEKAALLLSGTNEIERLVRYRMSGGGLDSAPYAPGFRLNHRRRVVELLTTTYGELPAEDKYAKLDQLYIMERIRRWASVHINTTAWWSVPELPLLNQSMIDLAYRLPANARLGSELMRWVIHLAVPAASLLTHNQRYDTRRRAIMPVAARAHGAMLDGLHLARKLLPKRRPRKAAASEHEFTYRQAFEDDLQASDMRTSMIFDGDWLARMIHAQADRPVGSNTVMNTILGLEFTLRAARQLRT